MIIIFVIVASLIFYLSITGYLKLIINKLKEITTLRIVLWILFVLWILVFLLVQMRLIGLYFTSYSKAISVLSLVLGTGASIVLHRKLWADFLRMTSGK